ncbi:uncharacterized protein LOC127243852 [Andrographis paniculata]|uniref:uncharacterized protein LOC127243852 n=1 Tax=Andrographis paniculata TaxID=175694 RepID=UPI0021E76502|nr:uncharacterized protein LOC127243852 [Andrographis paniculata]
MEPKEGEKLSLFTLKLNHNHELKLKELLRNLTSIELQLCSDASKEFVKILKSNEGSKFLRLYVESSSKLVEISQAWEFRKGKPGFPHILNLVAAIMKHSKDVGHGGVGQALNEFARWVIVEKMGDLYKELNSKEAKRQNAVLFLLASIVKRNSHLAWELAKVFDFKLAVFSKLAEVRLRAKKLVEGRTKNYSTRKAFVAFAMAFLEVANPRFMRGILQKKEMYLGVLRGLENDDDETVVHVLSVLRDKVLYSESLVPTGLRSVLFGTVTLKQLVSVSGREDFGEAAELANNVLVMACTDPMNGLMPDLERVPSPLHGNRKRLLGLMKNLKATEIALHKRLLLAIVNGRPSLGSAYLDEFPYNLDDLSSNKWFVAISLASDVVSAVTDGLSIGAVGRSPEFYIQNMQDILKCIGPRPFTRLVMNKGLLHSKSLVKHGTVKLVFEVLKLLGFLFEKMDHSSLTKNRMMHKWEALKAEIQHGVCLLLPDPQVLLSLLSPLNNYTKNLESTTKRKAESEIALESKPCASARKRLKTSAANEDVDILISGVDNTFEVDISGDGGVAELCEQQMENVDPIMEGVRNLWGLNQLTDLKDVDVYFYSKILETLQIYYRTIPMAMEGLVDLFKFLPNNPLALPTILQQSLLKLLNEHVNQFSGRMPAQMYKHLDSFVTLLICSSVREIKEQAYKLARAAMLSSGAFDNSTGEICAWFFFIPGYSGTRVFFEEQEVESVEKLSSIIISFLCHAISTIGNNLYRYMDSLRHYIYDKDGGKDLYIEFSPFIICILEHCLRLLSSKSRSFTLPQKSLISLYVCNSIKYILDTQVNAGALSYLIDRVLSEKLEKCDSKIVAMEFSTCPREWRPLKALLHFGRDILHQQYYNLHSNTLHLSMVSSIFFPESNHLADVSSTIWPEMFFTALNNVIHGRVKKEDISYMGDFESKESASHAFACYLKSAPFHVLFSSVMQSTSLHLFEQSGLLKLLFEKVSEMPYDHLVSSLCNVLFWINHTRLCHRDRSLDELKVVTEICFKLMEHILKKVFVEYTDIFSPAFGKAPTLHYEVEVVEVIFNHPAVVSFLNSPLSCGEELSDSVFGEPLEELLESAKQRVHMIDHGILNLIRTVSEHVFAICRDCAQDQVTDIRNWISRAFKVMEQKLFLAFKLKFDACLLLMDFKPLLPIFYAICTLVGCMSPFELLDLVNWLFSRISFDSTALSLNRNAHFVALHLASCCFDSLGGRQGYSFLGGTDETQFDVLEFEKIFFQVLDFGKRSKLTVADTCLLKAVQVIKYSHLSSSMALSRVVASTPVNIISYCLHGINPTKAELLYLITGMSPVHTSVFGFMLSEIVDNSFPPNANAVEETCKYSFSDEELVMLLPAVLLYLNSVKSKFEGQHCKYFERIILAYFRVLFGGFSEWKTFVSRSIFEIGVDGPSTATTEAFSKLFSDSLLGKAIHMTQEYLASSEEMSKSKSRSSLFKSVCPSRADDIFDNSLSERSLHLLKRPLDFVNRVVAKVKLCRIVLFPDCHQLHSQMGNGEREEIHSQVNSRIEKSRVRFLKMLIDSWIVIVSKSSKFLDHGGNIDGLDLSLARFLEIFVINNISELTTLMRDYLIQLDSLPFIESLVKSFLLHRFGDPVSMKMLRTVLTSLSDGKFSCGSVLQLLLAHSQFAQTIHMACGSHISTPLGLVLTPMPSILRSIVIATTDLDTSDFRSSKLTSQQHLNSLELVKLVRVLFRIYSQQKERNSVSETDLNSKELVYLLLSSYGATCSEIDLEIYNLITEIESNDASRAGTVAQMCYLWGIASSKVRKDWEHEKLAQSSDRKTMEALEERRKMIIRENLPVDPKLCAQTVLHFPYNRFVDSGTPRQQVYDPFFVLRFSIHSLSMGYIEPVEFASVGLLAVTFVSISSPDDDLRKLGYETLALFKTALENCRKKKDVSQLRLLLSYVQNGIDEPWKRIPSIVAVFVAEASLVLLDSLHDNYSTISKHIMSSSRANMKAIPLFQTFFSSSSKSFRADRLWMLRLLYVGLNSEDDARIYIRNSIFQNLLSCYSSPLSDNDSKGLTIQIVKKAVQLRKAVWFLVKNCGLISWLSSIVSSLSGNTSQDEKIFTRTQLPVILEIVNYITAPRNIFEWLQNTAMEQLSELSSQLYKLLADNIVLDVGKYNICSSILQILTTVLKISQKRKVYQPHFTLSDEGLLSLKNSVESATCDTSTVLGLKAVLMSTPPVTLLRMDHEKLSGFIKWAATAAIQSTSSNLRPEDCDNRSTAGKKVIEEPLTSKLLRWLTAAVILGKISCNLDMIIDSDILEKPNLDNLLSLFRHDDMASGETSSEDTLAAAILYLLQKVKFDHALLRSAVSALCLLLSHLFSEVDSSPTPLRALCLKIRCPAEAKPTWRWSYYQPWRDLTMEACDDKDRVEEIHGCEMLVMMASRAVRNGAGRSHRLTDDEDGAEFVGRVWDWETGLVHSSSV